MDQLPDVLAQAGADVQEGRLRGRPQRRQQARVEVAARPAREVQLQEAELAQARVVVDLPGLVALCARWTLSAAMHPRAVGETEGRLVRTHDLDDVLVNFTRGDAAVVH